MTQHSFLRKFTIWYTAALLLLAWMGPAAAQFADQATYAGTGAGSANAQTIVLPNMATYADALGVLVKFTPGATNTATTTLNPNSIGTAQVVKMGTAGLTALTGGELVAGMPVSIMYNGTFWVIMSPTTDVIQARNVGVSAIGFGSAVNLGLASSVSGNALSVCIGTGFAANPTPSSPITLAFRSTTQGAGNLDYASIASTDCLVVASGSTMGCQSGLACRLWVVGMNNAGTVSVCLFNALNPTGPALLSIDETQPQASASGTSGGNNSQTYYCNTGSLSGKAVRILGYLEATETTAGTWATGPSSLQVFGPGVKKSGDVVHFTQVTGANTLSITPLSGANLVKFSASASCIISNGFASVTGFRNGSITVNLQSYGGVVVGASSLQTESNISWVIYDAPHSASSTAYSLSIGGGACSGQTITLEEIMG